mmetsp:Transcript_21192/g.55234  ORF Transcript_21192/g.55234 Transcript_21192/m.55234 type:complete len:404 (-) Transcript_21192:61-1272(-)|eukprot:CAMPEP_0182926634 /NCGR_PEP_ID=MMETSP0105_2-20130417/12183_1 /TAXON_ID=81532 ORGANISM="Acanthoeca-like sp., Strain 10tr" /NCGR_SAMPLE_ID=MMETSP0105_2 /ASSEMBLY_ACC=CAM_ASM_000205 /LENGTH=403 /DNA_ID=CAMNT_0025064535 /DNA_START=61 /DNA_END=1272 /DNA_ORIENTATION=+
MAGVSARTWVAAAMVLMATTLAGATVATAAQDQPLSPPSLRTWHYSLRTVENRLEYSRRLRAAISRMPPGDQSISSGRLPLEVETQLLHELVLNNRTRRSTEGAVEQFLRGMGTEAMASITDLLECAHDLDDTFWELYHVIDVGTDRTEQEIIDILSTGASAVRVCLEAVGKDIPSFWSDLINAVSTAVACADIVDNVVNYQWFALGEHTYSCIHGLSRRSREGVPEAWTCPSHWYNSSAVCNIGCNTFDPDCANASVKRYHVASTQHPAPRSWVCLPRMYDDGTQCDLGCGAPDPDCNVRPRLPEVTWVPEQTFSIEHHRREIEMANGGPSLATDHPSRVGTQSGGSNDSVIFLSLAATIAAIALVALAVAIFKSRREASGKATEGQSKETDMSYALMDAVE